MQEVAVRHAVELLQARGVNFATAKCIDVGGSREVFLVTDAPGPTRAPTLLHRFLRRPRHSSSSGAVTQITRNPLLDVCANLTLLDHGFTGDLLNTGSDLKGDFLDDAFIAGLRRSFGVVFSFDTLEHVADPFRFCRHLVDIAQEGGHIYLQTVFAWEYHPSPHDYFRYSPDGLALCFRGAAASVISTGWVVQGVTSFILLQRAHG